MTATRDDIERELALTRAALASTEQQLSELREARSAEMARLERQAYWLERWRIDLDALDAPAPRAVLFVARRGRVLRLAGACAGAVAVSSVSVVVPGQGRRSLSRASCWTRSQRQRIDADVEMLVVDSARTDGSAAIARGRRRDA